LSLKIPLYDSEKTNNEVEKIRIDILWLWISDLNLGRLIIFNLVNK
jgi:hypothetical protein